MASGSCQLYLSIQSALIFELWTVLDHDPSSSESVGMHPLVYFEESPLRGLLLLVDFLLPLSQVMASNSRHLRFHVVVLVDIHYCSHVRLGLGPIFLILADAKTGIGLFLPNRY